MLTLLINSRKTRFTSDLKQIDWQRTGLLILLILASAAALWQFAMPRYRTITQNQFHPVPVIHETVKIQRVLVPCPPAGIVALDKAEVAKQLDLDWLQGGDIAGALEAGQDINLTAGGVPPLNGGTPPVAGNPADLQITATADLPESRHGIDMISVFNTKTGETTLVAKEQPSPWFQFRNDGAIGIRYGLDQRLLYTGDVYGRWDFLRIKDIYLSANGTLTTGGDARLQFGAEYRWGK